MKRLHLFWVGLLVSVALSSLGFAQDDDTGGKQKAFQAIKSSDDKETLELGLKKAKAAGLTDQQMLESKILWVVYRSNDMDYFQGLIPEIQKSIPKWEMKEALLLKRPKQVEATLHYAAALQADAKNDSAAAKKEILEAIWLDPANAADKYLPALKTLQPLDQKIPMDMKIDTVEGKKVTLAEFAKGNKALYVQIWATWCGPCLHLFPALSARSKLLPAQGVNVIAMNSELGREEAGGGNLAKAKELKLGKHMKLPWLVEPKGSPYTELLEIDSVPRAIVVDQQGNVLFNGHPMDAGLQSVMKKLGVTQFDLNAGMEGAE